MSAEHDPFHKLELLNAEIDVLIDEERYDEVKLDLSEDNNALIAKCFESDCSQTQEADNAWRDALLINGNQWPVEKAGDFQLKDTKGSSDQKAEPQTPATKIRQGWSALFWAKLLRAKIQEKNNDCYLYRLDDVVAYLERNLLPYEPVVPSDDKTIPPEFKLHFYYLMELSAASIDYGSIGYARRASRNLRTLPPLPETNNKCKHFSSFPETAKRWIALNEGVSYLHLREYHKASLEFNDIIWKYEECKNRQKGTNEYYLDRNELDLLYYPSVIYRATILLKQQFSYHAIQTLFRSLQLTDWTPYKKVRKDLLIAQAYRQMERRKESVKALNKLPKKHKLFPGYEFSLNLVHVSSAKIPEKNTGGQNKTKEAAARTRYVELVVSEFLEIVKCVGFPADHDRTKFRFWIEGKLKKKDHPTIDEIAKIIAKGLKDVKDMYDVMNDFLPWVEDNPMDRTGYYIQIAGLLAWSARIIAQWQDDMEGFKNETSFSEIKKNAIDLNSKLTEKAFELFRMIGIVKDDNSKEPQCFFCSDKRKIKLEHLHNEDYLSLVDDMIKVFSVKEAKIWFEDSLDNLKLKFAKAVTKKEETGGEDLHISRLNLRNKLALYSSANDCSWCMDDESYNTIFNKHFRHLTPCRPAADNNKGETIDPIERDRRLCALDYDKIMEAYEDRFQRRLNRLTKHFSPPADPQNSNFSPTDSVHFFGLRRWNSISPAEGLSLGGGYLLFRTGPRSVIDLGVAIDPGYNFIKNLFHCGFSLADIDVILLSHSHADHVRDFESMVNLLKELDDRKGQFRRVNVVLTLGTYERLQYVFDNPAFRLHVEPLVIDIEKDIDRDYFKKLGVESNTYFRFTREDGPVNSRRPWRVALDGNEADDQLKIWPTRAYHDDHSGRSDSFGFIIDIPSDSNGKKKLRFGYTGDTKWVGKKFYSEEQASYHPEGIFQQYTDCAVLLVHMGSLIDHKNEKPQRFSDKRPIKEWQECCKNIVREKNHPYLPGLIGLLNEIYNTNKGKPGLILLSEFGEELRGTIRTDLVERLKGVYGPRDGSKLRPHILPVDVGLDVVCQPVHYDGQNDYDRFQFWCAQCSRFHLVENIAYRHYGQDEAIFYLCQTCDKITSPDVLQDRLRHLYEVGRTLRTDDEESDPWK